METEAQEDQELAFWGIFDGEQESGNLWACPLALTMGHGVACQVCLSL